ncbi:response regulator transcription factor [Dactylosporangium sp. NPDC051485]|uniref:response regulator transcription factor n=1 Tax=Dactylosporangium sp. NPDC051485 TaxID=3154846 RepID=UPI0034418B6C
MRMMLVEDDARVAAALATALRRRGHEVVHCPTAQSALDAFAGEAFDLILLDLNLPDGDGIEVCRALRRKDETVAIIAVTARAEERDRVLGLRTGADDYVVKPYSMAELNARIEAVMRRAARAAPPPSETLTAGPVTVDTAARRVVVDGGREVALTRKEFEILAVLARTPGVVVSYDRLILAVWQTSFVGRHTLDVHVGSLRAKLDVPGLVQTVRGVGYRLAP